MSAEQTQQPTTVKEWFEAEKNPQIRTLLLERMDNPRQEAHTREFALKKGFTWSMTPEGFDVWKFFMDSGHLVLAPWRIVLAAGLYSRVLCERDGQMNYFSGTVDGGKDLLGSGIVRYMPLNDALDWLRDTHNLHVYAMLSGSNEPEFAWSYGAQSTQPAEEGGWVITKVIKHPSFKAFTVDGYPGYYEAMDAGMEVACRIVNERNREKSNG